ncbi:MAG: flagellar assembly protein T N-terminal domain-containing protein [Deltaproteobacteria bacterium]|nr:flagellar assembly protein T N-terminal domain-containing protein [Deltaproteobacteria bacterium]
MDIGRKAVSRKNNLICQRIRSLIVLAISVLILPALAVAAPSDGDVRIVDAIGTSFVSGGNSVIARDAALDDALRKAVEQAVGTLVSSDTMVENYQVLKDSVYTRTQGYIKNYTVINEALSGDLYQVTVRATVAVGNLKNDLDAVGVLHAKAGKPRVLFMIAEQNIGHKYYVFWWRGRAEYKGETVDMSAAEAASRRRRTGHKG